MLPDFLLILFILIYEKLFIYVPVILDDLAFFNLVKSLMNTFQNDMH